jgi:hypothetical protein
MLGIEELKEKYENKLWRFKSSNKRIIIKQLVFYAGSENYRIIYESEFNKTEYLNDISTEKFFDFLINLEDPYKIIKPPEPEKQNMEQETKPKEKKDLDSLTSTMYEAIDDLMADKIKIEKAIALSKLVQVVLNLEKHKHLIKTTPKK